MEGNKLASLAGENRWKHLRVSDMLDYNEKNPLTDLAEDKALFSEVKLQNLKTILPQKLNPFLAIKIFEKYLNLLSQRMISMELRTISEFKEMIFQKYYR